MHCCRARLINFLIFLEKPGRLDSGRLVLHFAIQGPRWCNDFQHIDIFIKISISLRTVAECNDSTIRGKINKN